MKKAELLKHVPARLPKGPKAKQIKADGQKALMLIIPKDIAGERVIHFMRKEGWLTYHIDRGYWSRQSLAWIEGGYNCIKLARKDLNKCAACILEETLLYLESRPNNKVKAIDPTTKQAFEYYKIYLEK